MEEILTIKNIIIYVFGINLIAFLAMFIDKRRAIKNALMTLVLLGGVIGLIAGMYKFHHKTQKPKFYIGFPTILITEIVLIIYYLVKYK